jgi:hypothetical protein
MPSLPQQLGFEFNEIEEQTETAHLPSAINEGIAGHLPGSTRLPSSHQQVTGAIWMRLMEGADIYQIAKNCRTSVEMTEKFYAAHIKNPLDAAAINVRHFKPAPVKRGKSESKEPSDDQE